MQLLIWQEDEGPLSHSSLLLILVWINNSMPYVTVCAVASRNWCRSMAGLPYCTHALIIRGRPGLKYYMHNYLVIRGPRDKVMYNQDCWEICWCDCIFRVIFPWNGCKVSRYGINYTSKCYGIAEETRLGSQDMSYDASWTCLVIPIYSF